MSTKKIKLTLLKSVSGRLKRHRDCVRGLGLRKINHCIEVDDTQSIRGMMKKVSYLLKVEE